MNKMNVATLLCLVFVWTSCTSINFEKVTSGYALKEPVDEEILTNSIISALQQYDWIPTENSPGKITAEYEKSSGLIVCHIVVLFGEKHYSIQYVDSKNLDYRENRRKTRASIHKNYVRWINNLNKTIYRKYRESMSVK